MKEKSTQSLGKSYEIWRVLDVANYLGVTVGHVYNLVSRGEIPHIKKGKLVFFIPNEIETWVLGG